MMHLMACGRIGFENGGASGSDSGGSISDGSISDGSAATAGCVAGETPGTYIADFELGAPTWAMTYGQAPVQTMYANGVLVVAPGTATPPKFGGVTSMKDDFRGRRFFVEVPAMV